MNNVEIQNSIQKRAGFTPHLFRLGKSQDGRVNKKGEGFTVLELLVSATVLVVIMTFVLANFRAGQYSGELDGVVKQIVDGIGSMRNATLGGQVVDIAGNRVFPAGGYAVNFDITPGESRSRFILYADGANDGVANGQYDTGEEVSGGIINFENVLLTQLCGLDQTSVDSIPCSNDPENPGAANWDSLGGDVLNIIFPVPGQVVANYELPGSYQYVGGTFYHEKTNQYGYFYISLLSGLVSGGEIDD